MSDETTTSERVGFCQDCGKPLTKETARTVGTGMFCEPCLQIRLAGAQPVQGGGYAPGYAAAPGGEPNVAGMSHPAFAALLGFIPGVGAMYNGQFAKGIAHLVVFAVLVSLANHVSDVFGLFVAGWIFYMAFEAYHTARARRDGLPLPNAFGFNDIGEKMGFGKNWPMGTPSPAVPRTPPVPPTPGTNPATAASQTAPSTEWTPVNQNPAPVTPTSNWAGYVPPVSAPYVAPTPVPPYSTPFQNVPVPPVVAPPSSSFPLVAVWLIGLGVLFAAGEWMPWWHVSSSSLVAIVLGAVAASIFVRRLGYLGGINYHGPILHMMRAPMILAVLAVLFLLQGVHAATLGQTWPVMLLAIGAVLLGERLGLGTQPYPVSYEAQTPVSVVPPVAHSTASEATPTATTIVEHNDERDGYTR